MPLTCGEALLRDTAKRKLGRTVTIGRPANLPLPHRGRPPCRYCGPCERGCITKSYFSSPSVTLPAAQATGRMTLTTDAVVSHVTIHFYTGGAAGVRSLDRFTGAVREECGKIVIHSPESW